MNDRVTNAQAALLAAATFHRRHDHHDNADVRTTADALLDWLRDHDADDAGWQRDRARVLDAIRDSPSQPHPLASRLGMTPGTVLAAIAALVDAADVVPREDGTYAAASSSDRVRERLDEYVHTRSTP
jgi:predicted Rossmann fold nucleotide-binding protein DprA/Smf involved in DNA uptake